jgi:hypothetical protein
MEKVAFDPAAIVSGGFVFHCMDWRFSMSRFVRGTLSLLSIVLVHADAA